jgi:hypothetical protein
MRITNVEAFYLRLAQIAARSDSSQDALLVKVCTDEGLYGWGEVDGSPYVSKAIIETPASHKWATGLRSVLIGENPLDTDRLWADDRWSACRKLVPDDPRLWPGEVFQLEAIVLRYVAARWSFILVGVSTHRDDLLGAGYAG